MYVFHFIKISCKNLLWLLKHILLKICSLWKILPSGDHTIFHKIMFERWAYVSVIPRKISQKLESKLVVILKVFQNNYIHFIEQFLINITYFYAKMQGFAAHFCNSELLRVIITWKLLFSERLTFSGGGGILVFGWNEQIFGWCRLLSHPPVGKNPVFCRCFFLEIQGRPFKDTSAWLLLLFNVFLLSVLSSYILTIFNWTCLSWKNCVKLIFWYIFLKHILNIVINEQKF